MKLSPALILRIGLGAVFLYAGVNSILNPSAWIGFVPELVEAIPYVTRELFLQAHGIFEIILSVALFTGIRKKETATLSFLSFLALILFYGIDDVTFRDIGLLAASYALVQLDKLA